MLKICAFYTKDTPYQAEINNLINSCRALGLDLYHKGYPSRGEWVQNCALKPHFLKHCLEEFPNHNILYVDADAIFRREPLLLSKLDCDIAIHIREGQEILSGTIYLPNKPKTRELVDKWIEAQDKELNTWDQKVLDKVLRETEYTVFNLPAGYTKIFDTMKVPDDEIIIEHYQASRRFKQDIRRLGKVERKYDVPDVIEGIRVRQAVDGSFFLPRCSSALAARLDKEYVRVPGEYRWMPRVKSGRDLAELRKVFAGKLCYLVGKGPSLDSLTAKYFKDKKAPVVCINEAIHAVEKLELPNPIYCMQQDMGLKDSCRPKKGMIIVSDQAKNHYADDDKYVFYPGDYGHTGSSLTVECAISLALSMGTSAFELLCFDSCVDQSTGYADCIGYGSERGGDPKRFLSHRKKIEAATKGCPIGFTEVVEPKSSADNKASDKTQP